HFFASWRKQLGIPRWPVIVYDDEDPAGSDTTLWDSPLAGARVVSFGDGALDISFAQFDTPKGLPRAVPGDATFPAIGGFRALGNRTFDIRIFVEDGRLESIRIDEGADWSDEARDSWNNTGRDLSELMGWPAPGDIELLIETATGYKPVTNRRDPR
ncbi:hypothetical protein PFZ49_15845, partial [Microbacterium lacticum]|uniref:hypothetical protein n=1 Tax=Microbacterium lacticum TaxID=33885 RepID=UPI003A8BD5C9